ncbi:L-serine ammonia-lyase, iron-sulfur-dependent subunit beta [Agrilactobacillus yilanensis]|uniref:L-serine deaminase n=1 Tax=Agrilactobacillus yilanensis TaxID=2485997 RepID=A0ABW4J596_9LACO|nr:L-serine ammonia-lyase, iron-sulfur-dependent subunit beta [Agrilactobacillus yilanensis]
MSQDYKSVFDIIGPVMVGPSSSHTAGAARIGKVMRLIYGAEPTQVDVYFYESFATTYKGHRTDYALVGGLLEMAPSDQRLSHSLEIAKEKGIKINFITKTEKAMHPNTVKAHLIKDDYEMEITGISIGGGAFQITEIDGFKIEFSLEMPTFLIRHKDVPGVIAEVTKLLSDNDINISTMTVNRQDKGCMAFMIIEVDSCSEPEIATQLRHLPNVINARFIERRS